MAASCMGAFGTYKFNYWDRQRSRRLRALDTAPSTPRIPEHNQLWVTKRYIPTDLRVTAPVPRYKPVVPDPKDLPVPERHWIPTAHNDSSASVGRDDEEEYVYRSQPSTRCEEWSTLRQMLPSRGTCVKSRPENWGTGFGRPPSTSNINKRLFPIINSPMTRYVDAMHSTNRLFKLY